MEQGRSDGNSMVCLSNNCRTIIIPSYYRAHFYFTTHLAVDGQSDEHQKEKGRPKLRWLQISHHLRVYDKRQPRTLTGNSLSKQKIKVKGQEFKPETF